MSRFDVDGYLNKLSKLVSPRPKDEPAEVSALDADIEPSPEQSVPEQQRPEPLAREKDTEAEADNADDLYSRLRAVPGPDGVKGRGLILCRERDEGRGEDAFLAVASEGRTLMGVFDGCGGSGARVYEAYDGHTGAWVASRAAALAAREWFADDKADRSGSGLAERIRTALEACRAGEPEGQLLLGGLSREFPTTVAAFARRAEGDLFDFYWCGDSRCYLLDGRGLHQVTVDDASITDAMRNLREDAPMTNVACASSAFAIHARGLRVRTPAVIIAATDGCFGYLPSPMAFEALLLETMSHSDTPEDWRREIDGALKDISGDDYTLAAWTHGFKSYRAMKRAFGKRLSLLRQVYPQEDASEAALAEQWQAYKRDYEALLPRNEEKRERG